MMPKKKKTTASDELVMVKSVRRTRSRRMKFCVQRGLGGMPSTSSAREPWLSWGIACQSLRKSKSVMLSTKLQPCFVRAKEL